MDIFTYLKNDHENVAEMMEQVLRARSDSVRKELFRQIRMELLLHAKTEEATFYNELRQHEEMQEKMGHAREEHEEVEEYLEKLGSIGIGTEKWIEQFGEFKHAVQHHVEEEEGDIFEKARKLIDPARAEELAQEMDALKQEEMEELQAA